MFSKACEYAIRATIYIAMQALKDNRVNLKEIAAAIDSPVAFTAKILQQLVKNDIVESVKGARGGFQIERANIDAIKLNQIVSAIDGDKIFKGCALGLNECNESLPCPVHFKFVEIRDNLEQMTKETSIYELATGLEVGLTFLKR